MPRSKPRRYRDPVKAEAIGGDEYAGGARETVSRGAAVGADPGDAQSERSDRREGYRGRPDCGHPGGYRWVMGVHHGVCSPNQYLCGCECVVEGARLGSLSLYPVEPVLVVAGGDPGAGNHDEPEPARP